MKSWELADIFSLPAKHVECAYISQNADIVDIAPVAAAVAEVPPVAAEEATATESY